MHLWFLLGRCQSPQCPNTCMGWHKGLSDLIRGLYLPHCSWLLTTTYLTEEMRKSKGRFQVTAD